MKYKTSPSFIPPLNSLPFSSSLTDFSAQQEEIGEIIESAPSTPLIIADEPKYPTQPARYTLEPCPVKPAKSTRTRENSCRGCNGVEDIGDWSNSILAEFNTIIANEIDELTRELERSKEEARIVRYKELLNEFGISDSESSIGGSSGGLDRSSRNDEIRGRRNGKLFNDEATTGFLLSLGYGEPPPPRLISARNDHRRKSGSLPEDLERVVDERARYHPPGGEILDLSGRTSYTVEDRLNTSSLPSKLDRGHASGEEEATEEAGGRAKYLGNDQPKKHVGISWRGAGEDEKKGVGSRLGPWDESNAKLPPRQRDAHRKTSLPVNLTGQKRRRAPRLARIRRNEEQMMMMDPDYEMDGEDKRQQLGGGRSLLDGNGPRSAPVTPTEEKRSPFSKILWKKHAPVFHESTDDVVLVRVSSLPDQDFLHLDNEALRAKNGGGGGKEGLSKKRAVSPLTLRSDISAKRLSESDKDVRQVSPVDLKKFSLSRSRGNDVGVSCDLPEDDNVGSIGSVDSGKFERVENVDVKKILDEQNSRSGSVSIYESSFFFSRERENIVAKLQCCVSRLSIFSLNFEDFFHFIKYC